MGEGLAGKFSNNGRRKVKHKCLQCRIVPCINLYGKSTSEPLEGGEIYVFRSSVKEKKHYPCEIGSLIFSLCRLSSLCVDFPSGEMFKQCIRDLKSSAYLLLSCHYRSSIQLLRPIVENYVAGIYWDAKFIVAESNEREFEDVRRNYFDFLEDKYEIPIADWYEVKTKSEGRRKKKLDADFCLSWMVKKNLTNNRFKSEVTGLMGELNKYLHPRGLMATEVKKPDCFSFVRYQEDEQQQCIKLFQDVVTLLVGVLYTYVSACFPDKMDSDEVKNALGLLKSLESLERELGRRLIFSKRLRKFVSEIPLVNDVKAQC